MDTTYAHLQDLYRVYLPYVLKNSAYATLSQKYLQTWVKTLITSYWVKIH